MKGAAVGMNITIVMNTHTATAIIAVADMNTGNSIITPMRAAAVKNTTMNTENVGVDITITSMTTMFRGIRRTANAKFATRTKNTAMCAAKV